MLTIEINLNKISECVYFERSDGSSDQWGLKDTNTEHRLMTPDYQTLTHNHHTKHHTHAVNIVPLSNQDIRHAKTREMSSEGRFML